MKMITPLWCVAEGLVVHSAAVDGVTLEYESHGTGDPVALIHLSLYADSFAPLMDQPALAGYRLVRYHRRGYVGSSQTAAPVTIGDQAADSGLQQLRSGLVCQKVLRADLTGIFLK
jgi:pimeloyl-ACP methyl ester carboxylesterase